MKIRFLFMILCWSWIGLAFGQTYGPPTTPSDPNDHSINTLPANIKWEKIDPALENSPEIAFLHTDPRTKATQLMIRMPKNFHVPQHWHSANETHTVLSGTFVVECEGQKMELPAGSFNYVPARMIHQAWTKPDEGTLLFIAVDGAWDLNWVEPPPKPEAK